MVFIGYPFIPELEIYLKVIVTIEKDVSKKIWDLGLILFIIGIISSFKVLITLEKFSDLIDVIIYLLLPIITAWLGFINNRVLK